MPQTRTVLSHFKQHRNFEPFVFSSAIKNPHSGTYSLRSTGPRRPPEKLLEKLYKTLLQRVSRWLRKRKKESMSVTSNVKLDFHFNVFAFLVGACHGAYGGSRFVKKAPSLTQPQESSVPWGAGTVPSPQSCLRTGRRQGAPSPPRAQGGDYAKEKNLSPQPLGPCGPAPDASPPAGLPVPLSGLGEDGHSRSVGYC